MKVLFAVSNDNITTSVVNKFQQKYKEIVTTKSVYYFNAIVNELKRDKEYNAIVIEEDLEPISNNNYEKIDKFLSEKLDNISDEASRPTGEDIPIILICSDRRTKSDQLLRQLFSMSIYNALIGNDRSLDKVCDLMKKPRNKKDAKLYYEIESDQVEYESHKDEIVSEEQIQSILNYYKKIGTNEKKCVQAFDRISKQYDNTQLRIIVKFLPIDVKAILEAYSPTYQKLMSNGTVLSNGKYNEYKPRNAKKPEKLDLIAKDVSEQATNLTKPVVIPSNMNVQNSVTESQTNLSNTKPHSQSTPNANHEYQPQAPQQQSPINQNQNYQPQVPLQQNTMNQNLNYQPQVPAQQNTMNQNPNYQPQVPAQPNIINQNQNYQQQTPQNQSAINLNQTYQPEMPQQTPINQNRNYQPQGKVYNPYVQQMPYNNTNREQQPYNPYATQQMRNPYMAQMPYGNMMQQSPFYSEPNMQQPYNPFNPYNNMQQTFNGQPTGEEAYQPSNNGAIQSIAGAEEQNSNGIEQTAPRPYNPNNNGNQQSIPNADEQNTNKITQETDSVEYTKNEIPQGNYSKEDTTASHIDETHMLGVEPITPMQPISGERALIEQKNQNTDMTEISSTNEQKQITTDTDNTISDSILPGVENEAKETIPTKRRRGRPRKIRTEAISTSELDNLPTEITGTEPIKRRRGRPRKIKATEEEENIEQIASTENVNGLQVAPKYNNMEPAEQQKTETTTNFNVLPTIEPVQNIVNEETHSLQDIQPIIREEEQNAKPFINENTQNVQDIQPTVNEEKQSVQDTQPVTDEPVLVNEGKQNSINLYDLDINDEDENNDDTSFNDYVVANNNIYNSLNQNGNSADISTNSITQNSNNINQMNTTINEDAPYLPMTTDSFSDDPFISPMTQPRIQPNMNHMGIIKNESKPISNTALAGSGKVVAFVGTTKNGTSFIVNNIALLLAESGVNTAVVDLTKNKNSYYMFTDNDANKIKNATESLKQLEMGQTSGLAVKNNFTVFTALPGDTSIQHINNENVLRNVSNSFEVTLLDCDYATDTKYFELANEIYLIQSMDAFTIQPLTKFLSELKSKNILDESKLKIVINKYLKLKKINDKMIVGGMSKYNEPAMTLQRDLFNPKKVQITTVPFDEQTYIKYLESIAMCELTLNGYSSNVLEGLEKLKNMVYPLVAGESRTPNNNMPYNNYGMNNNQGYQHQYPNRMNSQQFTSNMNETLNKMRNNNY